MDALTRLAARWRLAAPFAVVGIVSIIAGGLVAAVTASVPTRHSSWAVAYLVLVVGVAQVALGLGQALLAAHAPSPRVVAWQFSAFNAGNAGVLLGTLAGNTLVVDVGGALLATALALLLRAVRGGGARGGWALNAYRLLIAIVLVSIPIGLLLSYMRNG